MVDAPSPTGDVTTMGHRSIEHFPIERGHILTFARSIGDPNPVYEDPEYAATSEVGGIVAPPTFVQSGAQFEQNWPFRPRVGEPWLGSGREPTGVPSGPTTNETTNVLHAEQHFDYVRHPVAGDVLTAYDRPGRTWEKQGRRGGMLRFVETIRDYYDQAGELVVRSRGVGVITEHVVERG